MRVLLCAAVFLVASIGSAVGQAASRQAASDDPIVAAWAAKETCRNGGCSPVSGGVTVTATGTKTFVGTVSSALWLLGDAKCVHAVGQQVWHLTQVGTGRYQGTTDVFTSDSSPGFNCQHGPFSATWTLTGRNTLSVSSSAYGGIGHTFMRTPLLDETAPKVTVYPLTARRGTVVRLPFAVSDNSGRVTMHAAVYAGSRVYGPVGALRSAKGERQTIGIALPRSVTGSVRYCVWAEDGTGNGGEKATKACATLALR